MNHTTSESQYDPAASKPSPAPSTAGSTGTSGITVRTGPNGQMSFRRQRASRACETCHARKVRCDAASLGVPCTNCVAFSIECKIPTPKRKKNSKPKESTENEDSGGDIKPRQNVFPSQENDAFGYRKDQMSVDGMPATTLTESQVEQQATHDSAYAQLMKPKFARAPIKEAGRVAYLGESSNLSLLVQDRHGTTDVVHYPLPPNVGGSRASLNDLDSLELDILHQRGAFLLPPKPLCDELVDAYFRWVAPVVPIINRSRFLRHYRDPKNPPSLLLLQAILLAGSRVCTNSQLMDANGSTTPAAMTFYKRAKALYDANYEDDRVTIVQALVLLGWYWEGPEDVTKNVFYWTRVAMVVAQGSGMHRSVESSQLSKPDKRLWKRIWWTLFTRDRSVAVALGRPICINTDDSDVGMLTENDFIEDEVDFPAEYAPDPVHVQFFLQYVKLCEIMGLVLSQQYSVASKSRRMNAMDLTHSDMALADWLQNCPKEVCWQRSRHHFWAALLHANYYTTLCLLHRAHMPPASSVPSSYRVEEMAYPSRTIAFQAAGMITSIVENLQTHNEMGYTPAFIVYSLFSALIMHVYQMRSSVPSIVATCQERINICMQALKDVSKVWLVAKMVHTLFESILGNKVLEERLQKAAGKRHQRVRPEAQQQPQHQQQQPHQYQRRDLPPKRKFDDMDLGLPNGGPTPPVSYERSRPQTPAATPSRDELGQPVGAHQSPPGMPRESLTGTGLSRGNTRPTTPFNGQFSLPATPPDLFLVTRTSPNLSPSLWENFQPEQLFPDGTAIFPELSSPQNNAVDPQLQMQSQLQTQNMQQQQRHMMMNQMSSRNVPGSQSSPEMLTAMPAGMGMQGSQPQQMFGMENQQGWPMQGLDPPMSATGLDNGSQDDNWSNSSRSGPTAPTTLNVEDWFQFFGINAMSAPSSSDMLKKAFPHVDIDGHNLPPSPAPSSPRTGKGYAIATELVYTESNDQYNASSVPIYQSATFKQTSGGGGGEYDYTRSGNPTRTHLERHLAKVMSAQRALVVTSGMAALDVITRLLRPGDEVVTGDDLYGGTNRLLKYLSTNCDIIVHHVDTTVPEKVTEVLSPKTTMVLLETPTNPLIKIVDIPRLAAAAHQANPNCMVAVDNTMMSPLLLNPLELGADIVYESGTKYLSGHHDLMAGVIAVNDPALGERLYFPINASGCGLSPFDSWLLMRGVKTLKVRMDQQQSNAQRIADFLEAHGFKVRYPGLRSHPQYDLHHSMARGAGAVLSFETGDVGVSERIVESARIWAISVSFGCVNSLISMPCQMSHASIDAKTRQERALPEDLIRLCVGIEDVDDLIDDLRRALVQAGAVTITPDDFQAKNAAVAST